MFARVELAVRPDLIDTVAKETLRQIELTHPEIRKKIRWARFLDVYWFDVALSREEFIPIVTEICWDKVSRWMFSGNLMPSAAGKTGSLIDLMEASPYRPGVFWGIERRYRSGMVDACGKTLLEAIEVMLGKPLPQSRACSGGLLLLEGPELNEDALAAVARDVFSSELSQTWSLLPEDNFKKNDRFHQERVRFDLPRVMTRENSSVEKISFSEGEGSELETLIQKSKCAFSSAETKKIRKYLGQAEVKEERLLSGLSHFTDVDLAVMASVSQNLKAYPKNRIQQSSEALARPWVLHSFQEGTTSLLFDEETEVSLSVGVRPLSIDLEPKSGVLHALFKSQYAPLNHFSSDFRPVFSGGALFVADPQAQDLDHASEDGIHPRRIVQSATEGFQVASQVFGVPHLNGGVWVGSEYESLPVYVASTGGISKREKLGEDDSRNLRAPQSGDEVIYLGAPVGRDGLQGQSMSLDLFTHKRILEFLSDVRTQKLIRARVSAPVGGLGAALAQLALRVGGIKVQLSQVLTRYVGVRPYEILLSETQERVLLCVSSAQKEELFKFAQQRNLQAVSIGQVSSSQRLEIYWNDQKVSHFDPRFLVQLFEDESNQDKEQKKSSEHSEELEKAHEGLGSFPDLLNSTLIHLLSSPSIASKEALIRKCDYEVQGTSVMKPLHAHWESNLKFSFGPNDAAVIRPKWGSDQGLAIASGLNPKLAKRDPFLMAQSALDECVRNLMCTGVEYSSTGSWMGLVAGFAWSADSESVKSYHLADQGLSEASQGLGVSCLGAEVFWKEGCFPTVYLSGVGRVADLKQVVNAQFKTPGDCIYVLGPAQFGIQGSELERVSQCSGHRVGRPHWELAQKVYGWLGGQFGSYYSRLQSIHDVSEGGLLVAIAEGVLSKGLGVTLHFPEGVDPWEFAFGEGFHTFVVTLAKEDVSAVEQSWRDHQVPFFVIGTVENHGRLDYCSPQENKILSSIPTSQLKSAWMKEGYWE